MSRLKLKQVLSNLHYNEANDQLILSSSRVPTGELTWNDETATWENALGTWEGIRSPDFIISGSVELTSSAYTPGTLTIKGVDTFGDSGSFDSIDLGEY